MERSVPLPAKGKRNVLITSALPYVNNVPHLGNLIGCVLSADVFARYCRLRGYNVLYVCGTDEYGSSTEVKAAMDNMTPREICDKFHPLHKDIYDWFGIEFDAFGRTSNPEHTEVSQQICHKLLDNGFLTRENCQQLYCDKCEKFLADNLVEGVCPHCSSPCKGEECENCNAYLQASELLNPTCKVCLNSGLSYRTSEHLFFQRASLQDKLSHFCKETLTISNKEGLVNTLKMVSQPLLPKCITRDLKWGVSVPFEDFRHKVLYVWFEAPIGYISITKRLTSEWEQWWKNPDIVELHQFMGKDNVKFHSVDFPSTLFGTKENWTFPKYIHSTQFLMFNEGKFSKSKGIGIFGDDVKVTGIPVEVWRYYLISVRPEVSDTSFSWGDLQAKLNNELVATLGNFIHRVLSFVAKPRDKKGFDFEVPDASYDDMEEVDVALGEDIGICVQDYVNALEKVKLKKGLEAAMRVAHLGNRYLQGNKVWELYHANHPRCCFAIKTLVGVVCILGSLFLPFMPSFTEEVMRQLDVPLAEVTLDVEGEENWAKKPWCIVQSGHRIDTPRPLFKKLSNEDAESLLNELRGYQEAKVRDTMVSATFSKTMSEVFAK